jgi:hypothetical protein
MPGRRRIGNDHDDRGTTVVVRGALPSRDEAGRRSRNAIAQLSGWWNLDPRNWPTALTSPVAAHGGDVVHVLDIIGDGRRHCRYRMSFVVPHAEPASYPLVILYSQGGGTAALPASRFRVL